MLARGVMCDVREIYVYIYLVPSGDVCLGGSCCHLSAADAQGMCAEHVLGVSSLWDFDESRRVVI